MIKSVASKFTAKFRQPGLRNSSDPEKFNCILRYNITNEAEMHLYTKMSDDSIRNLWKCSRRQLSSLMSKHGEFSKTKLEVASNQNLSNSSNLNINYKIKSAEMPILHAEVPEFFPKASTTLTAERQDQGFFQGKNYEEIFPCSRHPANAGPIFSVIILVFYGG